VGTHFTEGPSLTVGRNTLSRRTVSGCGKEHTLQRELMSVEGTHFTKGVTVCGNSLYKGSYCLWELTLQKELLSVGKELNLQSDRFFLWEGTHFAVSLHSILSIGGLMMAARRIRTSVLRCCLMKAGLTN